MPTSNHIPTRARTQCHANKQEFARARAHTHTHTHTHKHTHTQTHTRVRTHTQSRPTVREDVPRWLWARLDVAAAVPHKPRRAARHLPVLVVGGNWGKGASHNFCVQTSPLSRCTAPPQTSQLGSRRASGREGGRRTADASSVFWRPSSRTARSAPPGRPSSLAPHERGLEPAAGGHSDEQLPGLPVGPTAAAAPGQRSSTWGADSRVVAGKKQGWSSGITPFTKLTLGVL
jgi:hypothetical protein